MESVSQLSSIHRDRGASHVRPVCRNHKNDHELVACSCLEEDPPKLGMRHSKCDYEVLESGAILILSAVDWMSTEKRACVDQRTLEAHRFPIPTLTTLVCPLLL